jgi:DNA polymerase-1
LRRGLGLIRRRKKEVKAQIEKDIERLQTELDAVVGHPLNINSPKQMTQWLYVELGLPEKKKLRKGKSEPTTTTDEDALEELYAKTGNEVLRKVIEIREKKKLVSTYLDIKLDEDGRIRCSYNIAGTETGRLSSSATARGTGTNLQNIPGGVIKSLFLADAGYTLINADLSQAEARVVAHLAGENRLIKIFDEGGDIHRRNASVIFNCKEQEVTPEQRQLAKTVVHASNYGMGPRTFAKNTGLSEKEADRLLRQYFATYPRIKLWHQSTKDTLRRTRILRNPFGRRRIFFNRWDESMAKECLAFVPQSTIADLVNLAIIRLHNIVKDNSNVQLLLQVHDSIVAQARDEVLGWAVDLIRKEMLIPLTINGKTFSIPVDIQIGKNWHDVEKIC